MTLTSTSVHARSAHRRTEDPGSEVRELPISQLVLGNYRPRQRFSPGQMHSLAQSISAHGVFQPLVVRPLGDELYEIVAGERRYLAAQELHLTHLPVILDPQHASYRPRPEMEQDPSFKQLIPYCVFRCNGEVFI